MRADADLAACADLVRRADPDRFRAVMAAPPAARSVLFALAALTVEVARAPWVASEPMIAEMRLQWWRDALAEIAEGAPARRHEVVTPLARVLSPQMAKLLDGAVAARRWDIYRDPFEDEAAFERYIDATAGTPVWVAAQALGPADETVVRDFACAAGVSNWLRAVPDLEARGRVPLIDGRPEAVRALAAAALDRLRSARRARAMVSRPAGAALLAGWQAGTVLAQAVDDPGRVARGSLGTGEARKRLSLIWRAGSGRW